MLTLRLRGFLEQHVLYRLMTCSNIGLDKMAVIYLSVLCMQLAKEIKTLSNKIVL